MTFCRAGYPVDSCAWIPLLYLIMAMILMVSLLALVEIHYF
jgi:hypothetical protein